MIKYDITTDGFLENKNKVFSFLQESIGEFYSNFNEWFDKVCNEILLSQDNRGSVIVLDNGEVVGVSIVKKDKNDPKICTIKIKDKYRNLGIGDNMMKISLGLFSNEELPNVYISVPGNTAETNNTCKFLSKFGFILKGINKLDDSKHELVFNKEGNQKSVILSIKQFWADKIRSGRKKVEFRRKTVPDDISYVFINNTNTDNPKISGYFKVKEVIKDTPENLWEKFNSVGGIEKEDFDDYFEGKDSGYAIVIDEYYDLDILPQLLFGENFKSPQYFKYL